MRFCFRIFVVHIVVLFGYFVVSHWIRSLLYIESGKFVLAWLWGHLFDFFRLSFGGGTLNTYPMRVHGYNHIERVV